MPEMLSARTEHANNVPVNKKNPFFDSPGADSLESLPLDSNNPFDLDSPKVVTVHSSNPTRDLVSPPEIKRAAGIAFQDLPPIEKVSISPCDSSTWATSTVTHSEASPSILKESKRIKNATGSESNVTSKKSKGKVDTVAWEMSSSLRKKINGMKKIIPKMVNAMNGTAPKNVDLTDLTIATLCLMPRNGAGMEQGRKCFERMRTSLMLHLIQQQGNGTWAKQDPANYEGEKARKQKGQIAKLNNLLHDCISDTEASFTEKTQDVSVGY